MNTWLKLIGCSKKPITGEPYCGCYKLKYVGFRKESKPGIRTGDYLFLYAAGGSKQIFALAEAINEPKRNDNYNPDEQGSCRWNLNVEYLINLPVDSGIHIDEISTEQRDLTASIQRQSHISLHPEESSLAFSKLQEKSLIQA